MSCVSWALVRVCDKIKRKSRYRLHARVALESLRLRYIAILKSKNITDQTANVTVRSQI